MNKIDNTQALQKMHDGELDAVVGGLESKTGLYVTMQSGAISGSTPPRGHAGR